MGALRRQRHLIFDFGDLQLRNLAKLWFFKLIMTKPNFKNSPMTSSLLRHQNWHQNSFTKIFHFGLLPIKIAGYDSVPLQHK